MTLDQASLKKDSFLLHQQALYLSKPALQWDLFYKRNSNHFFKDRHWTTREFPELSSSDPKHLLEVGCGSGSFLYPLLASYPNLTITAIDFSARAVDLVKEHPDFDPTRLSAFVADLSRPQSLCPPVASSSMDIVSAIFVLSALHPDSLPTAFENIYSTLKPGGILLFRDYAQGDLAQKRFKEKSRIEGNLYHRQDGTLSLFFSLDDLQTLCDNSGFRILQSEYVHKKVVNRKEALEMDRIWLQARIQKPLESI